MSNLPSSTATWPSIKILLVAFIRCQTKWNLLHICIYIQSIVPLIIQKSNLIFFGVIIVVYSCNETCPHGYFGSNCSSICDCGGGLCNPKHGTCQLSKQVLYYSYSPLLPPLMFIFSIPFLTSSLSLHVSNTKFFTLEITTLFFVVLWFYIWYNIIFDIYLYLQKSLCLVVFIK